MNTPAISVIIPVYNREKTLARAINSVLQQSFADFEVIIIDDGSIDQTANIVAQFNDTRVRFIQHHDNQGTSAARNSGIKQAKGEYIAFLDSDDQWHNDKLKQQYTALKQADTNVNVSCTYHYLKKFQHPCNPINQTTPSRQLALSLNSWL